MQRITGSNVGANNTYLDGDATTGFPGTSVKADALNALQEELAAILESNGIPLDSANNSQIVNLLNSRLARRHNLIINGNPKINQLKYATGTPTTAANQYTLDRWRVVVSGEALTWSLFNNVVTMTLPVGGIEQVISGYNIQSGTHTVSFTLTGDTVGSVDGVVKASGDTFELVGGTSCTLKLSSATATGTAALIVVNSGSEAIPYPHELDSVMLSACEHYMREIYLAFSGNVGSGVTYQAAISLNPPMHSTPVLLKETDVQATGFYAAPSTILSLSPVYFRAYRISTITADSKAWGSKFLIQAEE